MGVKQRRERERAQRRELILNAARSLLFSKGLEGTSINQIAKVAELGVASIYTYFKNKEEIIAGLAVEGVDLLHGAILEAVGEATDPRERLRRIALAYLAFSAAHKDYYNVINYFLTYHKPVLSPELKRTVDRQGARILSLVSDAVNQGIVDGTFSRAHGPRSSLMFWGTMHGLLHLRKFRETLLEGEDFDALFQFSVDSILQGMS